MKKEISNGVVLYVLGISEKAMWTVVGIVLTS